jgi:hypothetical protein
MAAWDFTFSQIDVPVLIGETIIHSSLVKQTDPPADAG